HVRGRGDRRRLPEAGGNTRPPHGGHPDELRRLTRLATFNVLHGRALAEGRVSNQKLAEACAALDADVLCLQEIDRNQPRSGSVDQIAVVAAATGAAAWRFEPAIVGEPGGRWHPAAGDGADPIGDPAYGVGIVSRRPVAAWHALHLAAA